MLQISFHSKWAQTINPHYQFSGTNRLKLFFNRCQKKQIRDGFKLIKMNPCNYKRGKRATARIQVRLHNCHWRNSSIIVRWHNAMLEREFRKSLQVMWTAQSLNIWLILPKPCLKFACLESRVVWAEYWEEDMWR